MYASIYICVHTHFFLYKLILNYITSSSFSILKRIEYSLIFLIIPQFGCLNDRTNSLKYSASLFHQSHPYEVI